VRSKRMPIFYAAMVLVAASCATSPQVDTPPEPSPTAPAAEMARAKEQRAYIKDNGLEAYAPDTFGKAEEAFLAAEKVYGKDDEQARAGLARALPLYDQTINEGFSKKIAEKKGNAESAKSRADGEKARMAAKETYAAAEAAYTKAGTEASASRNPEAVTAYEEAARRFEESAVQAADAKVKAQAAMESADASIQTTSERIKTIDKEMSSTEGVTP